jgi:hypothetical protein
MLKGLHLADQFLHAHGHQFVILDGNCRQFRWSDEGEVPRMGAGLEIRGGMPHARGHNRLLAQA